MTPVPAVRSSTLCNLAQSGQDKVSLASEMATANISDDVVEQILLDQEAMSRMQDEGGPALPATPESAAIQVEADQRKSVREHSILRWLRRVFVYGETTTSGKNFQ